MFWLGMRRTARSRGCRRFRCAGHLFPQTAAAQSWPSIAPAGFSMPLTAAKTRCWSSRSIRQAACSYIRAAHWIRGQESAGLYARSVGEVACRGQSGYAECRGVRARSAHRQADPDRAKRSRGRTGRGVVCVVSKTNILSETDRLSAPGRGSIHQRPACPRATA